MSTAHKPNSKYMAEHFDDEDELDRKCKLLSDWIKKSEHTIAFTGAGISTSCGIPDFRGPDGAWTLKAQGKKRTKRSTSVHKAVPSKCHMSLVELMNQGVLKYVVSQNCDGLHVRSGIDRRKISELHGNTNLERCHNKECGKEYLRDFRCRIYRPGRGKRKANGKRDHATGRRCGVCGGELRDTMVAFGENLNPTVLRRAEKNGRMADVCVVLGSSCTVTPAADIPEGVADRCKKLVIVNLQKTPLNHCAELVIHGKTDDVMMRVMKNLGYEIPEWYLRRKILVRWIDDEEDDSLQKVFVAGLDSVDLTFFEYVKRLTLTASVDDEEEVVKTSKVTPHCISLPRKVNEMTINLEFFKHYLEPNLQFRVKRPKSRKEKYMVLDIIYDVRTRKWKIEKDNSVNEREMKEFKKFLDKLK